MHRRDVDAKLLGKNPHARAPRSRQSLTDSFLQRRGYRRPTKTLPLAPGPRKSGADAFLNSETSPCLQASWCRAPVGAGIDRS